MVPTPLTAGGACRNITPGESVFLYGYPHVPRLSTGVHDPLLASALYLANGPTQFFIVEVDVIWLSKHQVAEARRRIAIQTGVAPDNIVVCASHTHSGPVTVPILSNVDDPAVPPPDADFVERVIQAITDAAVQAFDGAEGAEIAFTSAPSPTIGGNRLDPAGPRICEIPIVGVRSAADARQWIGVLFVNPVHPTVLHEDSKLISGDFPAACRTYLQTKLLGPNCPVLCPLGTAGNQSPRHVARSQTFEEAERLGGLLGEAIMEALISADYQPKTSLSLRRTTVSLPLRAMPSVEEASAALREARNRFAQLRESGAASGAIRSAECAVFGAEESLSLATGASSGALHGAQQSCLPAEIQVIGFGVRTLVCWPGEVFVEFGLKVQEHFPRAFIVTLANGELQGYLVTACAVQEKCYEAGNALFASPASGEMLVEATLGLLSELEVVPRTTG